LLRGVAIRRLTVASALQFKLGIFGIAGYDVTENVLFTGRGHTLDVGFDPLIILLI
jgi:hypothetical protein